MNEQEKPNKLDEYRELAIEQVNYIFDYCDKHMPGEYKIAGAPMEILTFVSLLGSLVAILVEAYDQDRVNTWLELDDIANYIYHKKAKVYSKVFDDPADD